MQIKDFFVVNVTCTFMSSHEYVLQYMSCFTGTVLGLNMAVTYFMQAATPTLGGYMLSTFGYPSIGVFGFIMSFVVTLMLCIGYGKKPWAAWGKFKQLLLGVMVSRW